MKLEDIYMIFFSMMKIYISGDEDASVGVGGVDDGKKAQSNMHFSSQDEKALNHFPK